MDRTEALLVQLVAYTKRASTRMAAEAEAAATAARFAGREAKMKIGKPLTPAKRCRRALHGSQRRGRLHAWGGRKEKKRERERAVVRL